MILKLVGKYVDVGTFAICGKNYGKNVILFRKTARRLTSVSRKYHPEIAKQGQTMKPEESRCPNLERKTTIITI